MGDNILTIKLITPKEGLYTKKEVGNYPQPITVKELLPIEK